MKETVYGNYPPARDPWTTYRSKENAYDIECLYKYIGSKYNGRSGVPTPKAPSPLQLSGTGYDFSRATQVAPPPHRAEIPDFRRQPKAFRPLGSCLGSRPASVHSVQRSVDKLGQQQQLQRPASKGRGSGPLIDLHIEGRCASAGQPRSSAGVAPHLTKPGSPQGGGTWATRVARESLEPHQKAAPRSESVHNRVRSAYVPRQKPTPPPRPTKSADPRHRARLADVFQEVNKSTEDQEEEELDPEVDKDEEGSMPDIPEDDTESLGVENPLDYDEELRKHGWKMEIPGDPLNLKRRCIPKRSSYTVVIPSSSIPPDPPQVHIETSEPFFSNTIPRRPLTFAVHQDWSSEVLMAKRLELQKRDGEKYKYRQNYFSFLY